MTAGQAPSWLNSAHPRIQLVNHQQIIPANYLPTYSSTAIIARLHHLAGLRDRYLYLNDDVFFLRLVKETDFYEGDRSLFYVNDQQVTAEDRVSESCHSDRNGVIFSQQFMQRECGLKVSLPVPEHAPKAMHRLWMEKLEQQFPAIFCDAMTGRFRRPNAPIIDDLFFRWLHHFGQVNYQYNQNVYIENCSPEATSQYEALLKGAHDALCLCINDTSDDMPEVTYAPYRQQMQTFLSMRFSEKSEFERC